MRYGSNSIFIFKGYDLVYGHVFDYVFGYTFGYVFGYGYGYVCGYGFIFQLSLLR